MVIKIQPPHHFHGSSILQSSSCIFLLKQSTWSQRKTSNPIESHIFWTFLYSYSNSIVYCLKSPSLSPLLIETLMSAHEIFMPRFIICLLNIYQFVNLYQTIYIFSRNSLIIKSAIHEFLGSLHFFSVMSPVPGLSLKQKKSIF